MSLKFMPFVLLTYLALFCLPILAQNFFEKKTPKEVKNVTRITLKGRHRTSQSWLVSYLGLRLPMAVNDAQLKAWQTKLLTTGVFLDVSVSTVKRAAPAKGHKLFIHLIEKWTLLPVLKADFGGGVPVQTFGAFDIHTFGRLWTFGALAKKYGDAPYGYSLFVRAPRWLDGSHYFALDYYRNFRVRSLYDREFNETQQVSQDQLKIRLALLKAFYFRDKPIQLGFNFLWTKQKPIKFSKGTNSGLFREEKATYEQFWLLPTFVYDEVSIYHLNLDGFRLSVKGGPIFTERSSESVLELESYYYKLLENDFGLASHAFAGSYSGDGFEQLYFLGGLDSIRGLPDSYLAGRKALYGNLELSKVFSKNSYLWTQGVVFMDAGSAGSSYTKVLKDVVTTFGVGLRLSVPRVSRLMFRLDYAWLAEDLGTNGISLGVNRFFDAYKPLE